MMASAAAAGSIDREVCVGAWRVDVGTAVPLPGESLSSAARRLAERVAAVRLAVPTATVRVASLLPSGRPIVSAEAGILPLSVSMAHERGLVAAAVCDGAGVGIDVVDASIVRAGLDRWLDPTERGLASPGMIWGAKESAYKAAGVDVAFHPLHVAITPIGEGAFSWTLREEWHSVRGAGRILPVGRFLVAVACTDEPRAEGGASVVTPAVRRRPGGVAPTARPLPSLPRPPVISEESQS